MSIQINGTTVINAPDRRFILGSTAPASPVQGHVRYNSSTNKFEVYDGTSWVVFPAEVIPPPAWSWGRNVDGALGDNTTFDKSSPISIVGGFTDWIQITSGNDASAGIRANGTAWSWGSVNFFGVLGDNTTTAKSSPVSVVGGFTDWVQISVGIYAHAAAVRANGTAWCWGYNSHGQLGTNNYTTTSSPVSVVGGFTDWVQISTGERHTAAVRANGTAWCWGRNNTGQLGDGSLANRLSPVSVVGGFTDWVQISAGWQHTGAVRASGTAWCWGYNANGQLGDNSTTTRSSPVSILSAGLPRWVQISTGGKLSSGSHSGAIKSDGTAWCWGFNGAGRLGDNTTTARSSPVSVVGGFFDWVQISTGARQTVAIRANGTAWGWGSNDSGRLGNNSSGSYHSSPISVVGGFTDWVNISSVYRHTVALRAL